jgi:hypothetical protein
LFYLGFIDKGSNGICRVPQAVTTLAGYITGLDENVKNAAAGTLEKLVRHGASFLALFQLR